MLFRCVGECVGETAAVDGEWGGLGRGRQGMGSQGKTDLGPTEASFLAKYPKWMGGG